MVAILAFLKAFEPFLLSEFDGPGIAELQLLADGAQSPDLKVILDGLVVLVKSVGDAELPKI